MIYSIFWVVFQKPEIIIVHPITTLFVMPANLLAKIFRLKSKFVLDVRTLPVRSRGITGKFKEKLIYLSISMAKKYFSGISVITPVLRNLIAENYDINPNKIGVWMSGVNTKLFNAHQSDNHENFESVEKFMVMYHGVLAENRGLLEVIEAIDIIKHDIPELLFFILGKGPGASTVKEKVKNLGLDRFVEFHEPVPLHKIPGYISRADIGIVPLPDLWCWRVSSPLKLLEYLAMGKSVILSPIEAHISVIENHPAANYLKDVSPESIAKELKKAFLNKDKLNQWGRTGRDLIQKKFTWEHQAKNFESYLESL